MYLLTFLYWHSRSCYRPTDWIPYYRTHILYYLYSTQ